MKKKTFEKSLIVELFEAFLYAVYQVLKLVFGVAVEIIKKKDFKRFRFIFDSEIFKSVFSKDESKLRITVKDLKPKKFEFKPCEDLIKIAHQIPLGVSLKSNEVNYLQQNEVGQHVLVAGATGEGKTTLMTTMIRHGLLHNRPIIIIDPKGDREDVDKIRKLAELSGRADKFKLFSLADPSKSFSYNPFKIGTPEQLKSKILEALGLEHEYYGSIAAQFLGNLFDILDFIKTKNELTLLSLYGYLTSPNDLGKVDLELKSMPRSEKLHEMMVKMHAIKTVKREDLQGLAAHISSMCMSEFSNILRSNENLLGEIDIAEALNNREIIYFQMNIAGYSDFGRRIGKLILQDLKLITSMIHAGQIEKNYDFALCLIDEFGSFATKSFAEFIKIVRSIHLGTVLFFQGIADLNAVSPEFANQILGNTKVKIVLRQDIDCDIETWSSMAGTIDSEISSYQTDHSGFDSARTGMGNVHEGKKMKVDFDVFRGLRVGEAIVINKGRHTQDIIKIWQQDLAKLELEFTKKMSNLVKKVANNYQTPTKYWQEIKK